MNVSSEISMASTTKALKISSMAENLATDFVSSLNDVDVKQNSSLQSHWQEVVNLFQDTVEGYKRIINLGARLNVTKEQLRVKSIAQTAEAFEDFVLDYAQHHLSDSMPEIHRVYKKLGSMLVSIIYTDLHELFKVTRIDRNTRSLNTKIIAAMMDPKQKQLEENVTLTFRNMETTDDERQCVFWKGFNEESLDGWSGEGCHVVTSESNSKETECSCNHLTHFAVLFDYDDAQTQITATDQKALEILTYVGLTLSLIGITVTMFSHIFLCDMHQPLSQIRVSLIGSLGAGQVIFLAGFTETRITPEHVQDTHCFPAVMVMISLSIAAGEDGVQSFVNDE
ncbi:EGF, latrophilin and seven transmembrane domain-containing protein 1 [Stylophora pistillata]|uniref:EGF, latrophilin and seven transmembrane domain-containing protein 1 n=1 Tax=Stylophora pistillata TaxID=50429 RepID=A0A2B4RMT2_STYPI|nr:EGF, latrophilin and seven transmembrane domain-containing protein 1 [Stylophora pistillata]